MRISAHAYPWDVLGDPSFPDRIPDGVDTVTLAAAYHSTRAATPLHPRHRVVDAPHAALYRPVRTSVWARRRLRPLAPEWTDGPDPFGVATRTLRAKGKRVAAWIVLTHNSRLGRAHPDVAVTNCFGDVYPYALCPAHAEVREYAATLVAESLLDTPIDEVSLEGCGHMGIAHNGHHEKTDGAWDAAASRWLSVCCCYACQAGWRSAGADPEAVIAALRRAATPPTADVPSDLADTILDGRHASADALRAEVLTAIRETAPHATITLHASPDPWATGPSPGLTDTAASDADVLLVPAWPTDAASATAVAAAAGRHGAVDAYVTALPPAAPEGLADHVDRLVAAGATGLALYHLGLAAGDRLAALAAVARRHRD
ncbi:MAG TPA: hypothetical protein VE172_18730 [Stackebrandtia sp.]|uniref:hypothetical protein n=1 Tax=Stackebrandtia sp. TaxID=2023065 RepID=UPI002D4EFFC7|nr:hypothetical protein [Stackebrandtia sp.]HZE40841.1 hypothetical protein [Stackebrandtia sp.]